VRKAEALSNLISERFKLTSAEFNLSSCTEIKWAGFQQKAAPEEGAVAEHLRSGIGFWFNVHSKPEFSNKIRKQPNYAAKFAADSSFKRRCAAYMQRYSAHLKVAAFARLQRR